MAHHHKLALTAKREAQKCYHGTVMKTKSNLAPIVSAFPHFSLEDAENCWCAAFVYHCCKKAGFPIPVKPNPCSCSLAGCGAWEELALSDNRIQYILPCSSPFNPVSGDIVLFDRVFQNAPHDHMGIVLENRENYILTAEGNVNNLSALLERKKDSHIRAYIRFPNEFIYDEKSRS